MKITIDIPKEFEKHFNNDRFKDSLERLKADAGTFCMAGKYEMELCEMLISAFKTAKLVKLGRWIENSDPGQNINEHYMCSECGCTFRNWANDNFCPNCGAEME